MFGVVAVSVNGSETIGDSVHTIIALMIFFVIFLLLFFFLFCAVSCKCCYKFSVKCKERLQVRFVEDTATCKVARIFISAYVCMFECSGTLAAFF